MRLWQKLWLLFTVIWVVVAGLNAFTILAFSEGDIERQKAIQPIVIAVVVPVVLYVVGMVWAYFRKKKSGSDPE
jgi:hypothetical protein